MSRLIQLHPRPLRRGFTLFEVAISLVLVSFGVVSVLMLFPVGIKAQEMARFRVYAACKAEEMVETFNATTNANPAIDTEGLMPWDTAGAYRAQAWDMEARLSSHRYGIMPLPVALAQRIDSDSDEIQQIISQGGYIYYSQPLATTETEEQGNPKAPPNDAQKLIFTISGYAQQNSLTMFAMKNWPYSTPMPSPPMHMSHMPDMWLPKPGTQAGGSYWSFHSWPYCGEDWDIPWESIPFNLDPDMGVVYDYPYVNPSAPPLPAGSHYPHIGYFPYACGTIYWGQTTTSIPYPAQVSPTTFADGTLGIAPCLQTALGYVQAAVWYFEKKMDPTGKYSMLFSSGNPGGSATLDPHADFVSTVETDRWQEVQAFRFLAHASTVLTSWISYSDSNPANMDLSARGALIPPATIYGFTSHGAGGSSNIYIYDGDIRYFHERAMYLLMQFYAMYPYDWAVPRSTNRTIMTDYPLLMSDLYSPPLVGSVFGSQPTVPAAGWRPISSEPIQHIGVSQTYPIMAAQSNQSPSWTIPSGIVALDASMMGGANTSPAPTSIFGNIDHYTLAAPFQPAERCREIVFWAADWQSYEDFETLPSAPVDASKYPLSGPRTTTGSGNVNPPTFSLWSQQRTFYQRMGDMAFRDEQLWAFRSPEKSMLFLQDMSQYPTGTPLVGLNGAYQWEMLNVPNQWGYPPPDQGANQSWVGKLDNTADHVFNGLYGADRNFNQVLDRGPLPRSVRIRAQLVGCFNFYDPRVPAILR